MSRLTITSSARAIWEGDERPVADLSQLELGAGKVVGSIGLDLDWDLIEQGIIGGDVSVRSDSDSRLLVDVDFWSPQSLNADTKDRLKRDVIAHWCDGFGEGGILLATKLGEALVLANEDVSALHVKEAEDGRIVPPASRVAIAARLGQLTELAAAVDSGDDINGELGGYTALHLALGEGHRDVIGFLLARGVDVNRPDRMAHSPLASVALSNELDDVASTDIARALLVKGAVLPAPEAREQALHFALSRKKTKLARILSESVSE